ncbi:MAG: bifunctional hydroxymethylpyrimidine kinase/phosphomethylpyrimidine kinase [Chlorobiales bacterium]|nr:bifunctional hydroxymethylpyrimidine kinase/phosphomethylpyrimidine kinase [Chlorobiales bacterium]
MKAYKTVLTIAGSDSSGGAGIQADIKTFAALECYGLSIITALTAQNTTGVNAIYPLSKQCITAQFMSIATDISIDAVKIGMLGSAETIRTVAALIRNLKGSPPIILDTVLASSGGTPLLPSEAISILKKELFPIASIITPNLPEAALLTGMKHSHLTPQAIEETALKLLEAGPSSVLVKGGHNEGDECCDCLLYDNRFFWFSSKKIATGNTHGTGCTLSSAIAAFMARGKTTEIAVANAKSYINEALLAGAAYRLGNGSGPLHHLFRLWQ